MIKTYLEQLLILLLRSECDTENPTLFSSRETMMEHVAEEMVKKLDTYVYGKISVDEFCKEMKYSKAYLSKILKQNLGLSISA